MNINLLPKKFIHNRANELIIFCALISFSVLLALSLLSYFSYRLRVNNYQTSIQTIQVEKILAEQSLSELSATKAKALQEFIEAEKNQKALVYPIMSTFEEVTEEVDAQIVSYSLSLQSANDYQNTNFSENGLELLPTVTMVVEGDLFDSLAEIKGAFEEIEWVYDIRYQYITADEVPARAEITLRLIKDEIPMMVSEEGDQND